MLLLLFLNVELLPLLDVENCFLLALLLFIIPCVGVSFRIDLASVDDLQFLSLVV